MKWFLILWAAPIGLLVGWYTLSYHDIHFGVTMLTREAHDLVFQIYGHVLGIEPEAIPPLLLRALIVDTLLVMAIIAFRRRAAIRTWWSSRDRQTLAAREPKESLSSAP